ncbi:MULTISPECIES: NAD(P)H-dependent oxidoreductase [Enterococcus]|uniref:NAD(P)H-dependent oxidoreductase n=1 Tax=Enterococcus TaxID=1350 RepID=UPI00065E9821|nr:MULTISPECIES: NAD(P)H-dependent oxidoreductase [Enterococcus]KAF1304982.1 flavoprotein [Enterococcus sp. JM9B]
MKALIVFAHPKKESFSHALVATLEEALKKKGYEVNVRDLYQMNFNPVLSGPDAIHIENGKFVRDNETFPEDVQVEQKFIEESDLLIYVFPSWWNGMPAIMKGYVDRVFQHGFAYSFESDEPKKRFAGKRALFFTPTGQPQNEDGSDSPIDRAMKTVTSEWMFNSNGTEVIDHVFYGRVPYKTREELAEYLADAQRRIEEL